MPITPVIMSGGAGSRLWPISDDATPKQFLALTGEKTMLQETVRRLQGELFENTVVLLANASQSDLIKTQMGDQKSIVIIEPCRRNTAAAAAAAAFYVAEQKTEDDLLLLAPADHVITDITAFHAAIAKARAAALAGNIVTFGIEPEGPETGYGYIKRTTDAISTGVYKVEAFREKPDLATAKSYCDSGDYDWNSGIFLFSARHFLTEIERFEPKVFAAVKQAYDKAPSGDATIPLDKPAFEQAPSISIDYAVMERTNHAAVVPCSIGWSDLGSYRSLVDLRRSMDRPTFPPSSEFHDAKDCLIMSDGPEVSIVGLNNIGVIIDKGRVLVLDLDKSQDVKHIANARKS